MTPAVSGLVGVKVAMRPVAASTITDAAATGVAPGAGPVTMKVAVVTVDGSSRNPEGTLNAALILAPGHTPVAPAVGLVESTDTFVGPPGGGGMIAPAVVKVHT